VKTELEEAWAAADEYELLWHRAREGCRGAQRGLERAAGRLRREREKSEELQLDLAHERSMRAKAEAEVRSLEKKVQRLSLRILELWGAE
jgi:chromosome segregation ATPase